MTNPAHQIAEELVYEFSINEPNPYHAKWDLLVELIESALEEAYKKGHDDGRSAGSEFWNKDADQK